MASKTDLELIDDFLHGKVEGFNELVRRYGEKVYWAARRIVGTHEDADDIVQEVFVRVYERLKGFRADSSFYTWLYRITINLSLNAVSKRRLREFVRFDELFEGTYEEGDQADAHVLKQEYQTILERAIERLPAKQKMVFIMLYPS